jgi:hypothetical protein
MIATTSALVTRTSTAKLKVGDVIQHGNMFTGFNYTTVVELNHSNHSNMMQVLEKFGRGGVAGNWYGKNAIWYVVKEAN